MPNNPKQPPLPLHETATLRLIDASINRATEGLRVIEDFVRFVQDDRLLSRLTKTLRHDLARLVSSQASLGNLPQGLVPKGDSAEKKSACPTPSTDPLDTPLETPWAAINLHGARETVRDVGTQITTTAENCRGTPLSVCAASFQRVKQALRSLEE
jgi:thiamine-phosphate pyrophosphorylase